VSGDWEGIRFEDAEYAARHARLCEAASAADLDAVVLSDDRVTWYLTGFGDVGPIGSAARPRVLVVPVKGDPAFFVHRSTTRCVQEMSAVRDVRGYRPLGCAPVDEVAAFLAEGGCEQVGLELGGQLRPMITPGDVLDLAGRVRGFADCSPVVWALRMVKSQEEAARIRAACAATDRAYARAFARLRPGMTEREAARLLKGTLAEEGADAGWVWVASGRWEFDRIDGVVRNRRFEPGDLVFVDMGACVGGYWADFSRACVLGPATAGQVALQELIVEATSAGVDALVTGRTTAEAARAVEAAMTARELEFSSRAERYGHGLGMAVTEPPDVWMTDETEIVPGMVLTMEPGTWTEAGMFHCEQVVLVTTTGNEVLSRADSRLTEVLA
jgi:Xaa-Pro dipeptidase